MSQPLGSTRYHPKRKRGHQTSPCTKMTSLTHMVRSSFIVCHREHLLLFSWHCFPCFLIAYSWWYSLVLYWQSPYKFICRPRPAPTDCFAHLGFRKNELQTSICFYLNQVLKLTVCPPSANQFTTWCIQPGQCDLQYSCWLLLNRLVRPEIKQFWWASVDKLWPQQAAPYLRVSSMQCGSSSSADSSIRPESPKWLYLRSSSLRWEGLELRAEAREAHPSCVIRQPDSLQTQQACHIISEHRHLLWGKTHYCYH